VIFRNKISTTNNFFNLLQQGFRRNIANSFRIMSCKFCWNRSIFG